jgi:hypothetical protein
MSSSMQLTAANGACIQDLLNLYTKAGVKGTPVTFLMTDNQVGAGSS